jgi:hypothetical protein
MRRHLTGLALGAAAGFAATEAAALRWRLDPCPPPQPAWHLAASDPALRVFARQVAGHGVGSRERGFLEYGALVLKPFLDHGRGEREAKFYADAFADDASPAIAALRRFLPRYHGAVAVRAADGSERLYLSLEDVTHGFAYPCIADIKMGSWLWQGGPILKSLKEKYKYPHQEALGIRITGMRVERQGLLRTHDRAFGRALTAETFADGLAEFFELPCASGAGTCVHPGLIDGIMRELRVQRQGIAEQRDYKFTASSLLLVYEGDEAAHDPRRPVPPFRVVMIDFGNLLRPTPAERDAAGPVDPRYLRGVDTLLGGLAKVRERLQP